MDEQNYSIAINIFEAQYLLHPPPPQKKPVI